MEQSLSTEKPLCEICQKLPFTQAHSEITAGNDNFWALGELEEIRFNDCPFCQLITSICDSQTKGASSVRDAVDETAESLENGLFLEWQPNGSYFRGLGRLKGSLICFSELDAGSAQSWTKPPLGPYIDLQKPKRWL